MENKIDWPAFTASDSPMDMLVGLSRYYGQDEEFVIGGGGNTSVKIGNRLYVKSSGRALVNIDASGFIEMDRTALTAILQGPLESDPVQREEEFKRQIKAARVAGEQLKLVFQSYRVHGGDPIRPSVESVLHNILPATFVVHTHPTVVNAVTCCKGGEGIFNTLFGQEYMWLPYTDPGVTLARALAAALVEYTRRTCRPCPPAIFVQNHGLIVCGNTPDEIRQRTDAVIAAIQKTLTGRPQNEPFGQTSQAMHLEQTQAMINMIAPALRGLLANGPALNIVTFDDSPVALSLVTGRDGRTAALGGPLTPDQIVYCNSYPLWVHMGDASTPEQVVALLRREIVDYQTARGYAPKIVLVSGLGLFAAGDDFAGASTAAKVYLDAVKVMAAASRLGGVSPMSDAHRQFIECWEAEAYRKDVAAASARAGRAAGKVVVVTGAAQGFGLEIAKDFAAQAAHVAVTDVNLNGARQAAQAMCEQAGAGRAMAVAINVADGASVAAAIHQVVRTFGGLDVLVSNAGVLRAESVKTQSERDFDFVTSVNYKGYYICVQKASPVMAVQHLARPSAWSDIVQINSKSGLVGSNRNFAYAGSKFGGIGLTQSFAMELVTDGIKVNAICPGNFFDGPLWSDPDNGLFVQYLRTGKVPGAKTIADVRKAYEAKVPMGRGTEAADVMRAIYYVIEQQYETGQAIPVTGGQVMLS